jgi:O-antigen ligase
VAFAGAYRWTLVPLVAGTAWLAIVVAPRPWRAAHRGLDIAITACLAAIGAQLLPLPSDTRRFLSPAADLVEAQLLLPVAEASGRVARPLSLDPEQTAWALGVGVVLALVYWSARTIFEQDGGLRTIGRAIAWAGLAMSAVAFVAHRTAPRLIYGFWAPITRSDNPTPYGPFVNRNHFATWLLLAVPLVGGYVIARLSTRAADRPFDVEGALDARMVGLIGSVCLMTAALLSSMSRSGIVGLAVALLVLVVLAGRRITVGRLAWLAAGIALLLAVATAYVDVPGLLSRLDDAAPSGLGGRTAIWNETWPMALDFARTGLGVGAFERGMLVYQQSPRSIFFNHAHNQYLQLLVEGGLLLLVPCAVSVIAGTREIVLRLQRDRTPMFWMRAGAASGLAAVCVQSVWEVGLRMPANAVLFAIAAAVATYDTTASAPAAPSVRRE